MHPALWNPTLTLDPLLAIPGEHVVPVLLAARFGELLPPLGLLLLLGSIVCLIRERRRRLASERRHLQELERTRNELRLADEGLRRSEDGFARAFQSGPVPMAITTQEDGRFVNANDSFLRLVGYDRASLIGRTSLELNLWPDPQHRQDLLTQLTREGAAQDREGQIYTSSGEIRNVLAAVESIQLNETPCLFTILHDITERKHAEERLRHSEERFQLIASASQDTVWDWDCARNHLWWNEGIETHFGYSRDATITRTDWWRERIHPEDRPRVLSGFETLLNGTEAFWSAEYRFARADGSYADVLNRAKVILDRKGQPIRMLGTLSDITERKRFLAEMAAARDAAVEALRLKSEFLANISHEVRTPLNGIVGMTVLLQDTPMSEEQRDYVETIHSSTNALLAIINDILDFSRIEAGKVHFETLDFDLRTTVDSTIEMLADRAQEKHIELVTLIDGDAPDLLRGDSGRLRQVLTNLVVNALKFTEQGEVVVQVSRVSETEANVVLLFSVRDTGMGIAQDALPYLFEAFSQVDGSTTRKHGGTGLGLTISKQLVELMGGQIGVESTPGEGSTFWFTAQLGKQRESSRKDSKHRPEDFSGARVLVADHHAATRQLLLGAAAALNAEGVAAASAADALHCLRQAATEGRGFDLAVLDHDLRADDGSRLATTFKQDPLLKSVPLLLVVPRGREKDTTLLRSTGADGIVSRPLRQRSLMASMTRLLKSPSSHETRLWLDRRPPREPGFLAPLLGTPRVCRILVAEDNPINQRVAIALLEKLGYQAQAVATGTEVLRATEAVHYDIVLMDCQLPEIDGFEATREIRRREKLLEKSTASRAYIIAMTAFAQSRARERCLAAGMDDYLSKPIRIEALTNVLRKPLAELPTITSTPPSPSETAPTPSSPPTEILHREAIEALRQLRSDRHPNPVSDMIAMFLRQAPACLQEIDISITRYEARAVEKAAHNLKGSASTMGAKRLAKLCAALETEAKKGSLQVASHLLHEIQQEYSKVREELLSLS